MTEILHNRIRWLLAALMLLLTSGGISAATETVTRLYDGTLLTKTVRTVDGVQYTHLSWLGLDATRMPGAPEMPVEYIRFLVPVYTNNFRVTVTTGGLSRQTLDAPVFPSQEPVPTSYEGPVEFTVPDPQYYSATQPIRAEYVEDGFVDGCNHIVTVAVYPASYDDASLSVTTASTVNVTLEYDSCTAAELESTPIFPPRASKYLDLKSMVVNGERTANRLYAPREKASPDAPEYYYIITPRNLEEAFQDLAIWKRQKGYNVIVKCIEDICADPSYEVGATYYWDGKTPQEVLDSAMSLRCYLKDEFQEHGHFFCLLAGDWRTSMPIRKATLDESCTDNGEFSIPTDIYFSNFAEEMPLIRRKNMTIYSIDLNKTSFTPSIAVGRLLCATPEEVENNFYKLRMYEANPGYGDNEYLSKGVFFEGCGIDWKDSVYIHTNCIQGNSKELRPECQFLDSIILFQDYYHVTKAGLKLDSNAYCSEDTLYGPTALEIMREIETSGFSSWHAHGTPYGISCGVYSNVIYSHDSRIGLKPYLGTRYNNYPNSGLNNVSNYGKPGFVYSISCDNAPFDVLTWGEGNTTEFKFNDTNLGRTWTVGGRNGGPAAVMNTRNGRVSIFPEKIAFSSQIEYNWLLKIINIHKIGESFRQAIQDYNIGSKLALAPANLIGDPEFEIWLGKPNEFNFEIIPLETGIQIFGDIPDSVSLIAYNGDDNLTEHLNAQPETIISKFNGEFCISLWKPNYLPIITLYGQNGTLEISKKYVVRNAVLGRSSANISSTQAYTIGDGGKLEVEAIDKISTFAGFIIENGGEVILKCDRDVDLNGVTVKKGGKLTVIARNVTMGKDFKVEPGGISRIFN